MKKLRLDVEELRVESFESEAREPGSGTVRGYSGGACSYDTLCDVLTCAGGCDSGDRDGGQPY